MPGGAENGPAEGNGQKEAQSLQQELEALKAANKEYLDLAKRIQADFDNYKKRAQRDREDVVRAANDRLLADLLGTVDDLERALAPGIGDEELRKGVAQVHANLMALLRSYGVREMPSEGRFDPALHDCLAACAGEEGAILETYQKGYLLGNRVIRHAKVKVGRSNKEEDKNG